MSLYLCAFTDDHEVAGVDVGAYDDFGQFRDAVAELLEGGDAGSRFPVLMNHSDSDGEWTKSDLRDLKHELAEIATSPLANRFTDVIGRPLAEQLLELVDQALIAGVPVLFQ